MNKYIVALIASLAIAGSVAAQVSVTAPWARATVPVQKSSGAFMVLQSAHDARLIDVTSPLAAGVEMHQSQMQGALMKMSQVDSISLPAGKPVNLASGGYHLMLIGLKQQLKEGSTVPLTLVIQSAKGKTERITISVPVKALSYAPAPAAPTPSAHAGH